MHKGRGSDRLGSPQLAWSRVQGCHCRRATYVTGGCEVPFTRYDGRRHSQTRMSMVVVVTAAVVVVVIVDVVASATEQSSRM